MREQGVDRGESRVAGAHAVVAFDLEVFEERADEHRVEVLEGQLGRRLAGALLGEVQQQSECVSIGGDRVGTCSELAE